MSFINLELMGIQSPDIMADSIDAKQMLVTLNSKLDWLNGLIYAGVTKAWQRDVVSNDIQFEVPIGPLIVYI